MRRDIVTYESVKDNIVQVNGQNVILDFAVAELYGVETKRINEAVRNNPDKFPKGYVLELDNQASAILRSKILTLKQLSGSGKGTKYNYKAFTERGLYMLATILKGERAVQTTIAIIDTFAKLRELQRTISAVTTAEDDKQRQSLLEKSGKIVDDIFGEAFTTGETENEIELNLAVLKLKHKVKRKKE